MEFVEEKVSRPWGVIYSRRYQAAAPRATVVLVHGFGEHSGRYQALVRHLLEHGYSVTLYDHRGHGKSSGLYGHIDRFSHYEDDLQVIVDSARKTPAGEKLFLIGHSMGGLVTLRYLTRAEATVDGAVVSAPLLAIAARVPAHKLLIARIGATLAPRLRLPNDIDPAVLSRDPGVGRAYAADPLVGRLVSTRWFAEAVKAMKEVKTAAAKITTPLLLLHGSEDRLAAVEATKEVYPLIASRDKELRLLEGFYHELFNEPEKEEIYRRVTDWLGARAAAA
jgi:alpha-beta hydrolase superfamily lysophospholipase